MCCFIKIGLQKWIIFWCQGFFSLNLNVKNGCKNEFQDNNEKFCSWFKNRVPLKIDFRADGTYESHPTAWEFNENVHFIFEIHKKSLFPTLSGFDSLNDASLINEHFRFFGSLFFYILLMKQIVSKMFFLKITFTKWFTNPFR